MIFFYLFALVLVFFSYKSVRGGVNYLNFFKRELSKPKSDFAPFCSIIAPCRGVDEDLEANLSALFKQNFPHFEIIFVADSETDEAVSIIKNLINSKSDSQKSQLVIAGQAANEGQKVHNLRAAVERVSGESKIFVFVDSDARPSANWLMGLIAPLADESIGCTTGYRWFVSKNCSFASELRAAWNASIASALGANLKNNFCWGGSTAIRRETFEKIKMREKWRGTLSDDFMLTRALHENNLPIYFVPQALTASVGNCDWRELFEFTTRQMKITRVYAPQLWKQSLLGAFLFNLVFVWGIFILIFGSAISFSFWLTVVVLSLIAVFSTAKSWLRLNAVKLVLKDYENDLKKQFWAQNTLWIFSPAIYLYNCLRAFFSNEISWRGITYKLKSPREIIVERSKK